ncbi:hypothetical protein DV735_g2899, partial [Chaetothyriales sp. CBS 134920]
MTKYSVLPTWPFLLFGVVEPALLIAGYITNLRDPAKYLHDQAPHLSSTPVSHLTQQALSVTLQLGNVLLLLALLAFVCTWTHHPDTVKRYLLVLALADIGHVYASYFALGDDYFWNPPTWNATAWGNIGASVFLNLNRWLTLAGLFGVVGGRKASHAKRAK